MLAESFFLGYTVFYARYIGKELFFMGCSHNCDSCSSHCGGEKSLKVAANPAASASCPSCRNLVVLQGAQQRFFDFLIACAYGPYPCDQHKVDAVGKFVLVETVRLTKQTLDAVSFHRTRQLGTDGESQPVVAELVPAAVDHNVFSCRGHTTMIQSAEFVVFL